MRGERLAWADRPKTVTAVRRESDASTMTPEEVRERVRLDMEYANRASVWLDVWIAMKTIPCLLGDSARSR